ncbi:MAG: transcription termination factor NusA [Syntrophothermus sp.]
MNLELMQALNELMYDRGISREVLMEAIDAAIVSAYKRNYNSAQNVRVQLDEKSGQIKVFACKTVVPEVEDPRLEMSLPEARAINPSYELQDVVEVEVTPRDFGRIAAQTAKQVVVQRIREAERELIFDEYSNKQDDIVTGIVQRHEQRNVLVDLGRIEAVLTPSEQMPTENYRHGDRIKVYIVEVRKTPKGPSVLISRTHPGLLKRLFELEVPEIYEGIVEIKSVAREAGYRSKLAVASRDPNVDPVGACVGQKGGRVQTIVNELRGEKIDIVAWDADIARFVANALSPAKVVSVYPNETTKVARVVVPDHQLSLAIGKEGQNARLAARLTGWKIDIKSESQMAEILEQEELSQDEATLTKPEWEPETVAEPVNRQVEEPASEAAEPLTVAAQPAGVEPETDEVDGDEVDEIDVDLLDSLVAELIGGAEKGKKSVEPPPEPAKPKKTKKAAAPKEKPVILRDLKELELLTLPGEEPGRQEDEDGVSTDGSTTGEPQTEPSKTRKKATRSRKN